MPSLSYAIKIIITLSAAVLSIFSALVVAVVFMFFGGMGELIDLLNSSEQVIKKELGLTLLKILGAFPVGAFILWSTAGFVTELWSKKT